MTPKLRAFQLPIEAECYAAWNEGAKVVMPVLPTGAGKTVVFSKMVSDLKAPSCVIAHRRELVSQISLALARNGVHHRIIGPRELQRACAALHMRKLGRRYEEATAHVAVAGVDTLVKRGEELRKWLGTVQLVVQDEGHHVLRDNKWGEAFAMFPNARGLFVTATPERADGKGLGRHANGLVDRLLIGPTGRELIDSGYLTDYRIICPPSDIDYSQVPTTPGGDLSLPKLRDVVHRSGTIVGDVVRSYKKFAMGKLGVTFTVDVAAAVEIAAAYRAGGVPAEAVSADTPDDLRFTILQRLENREILQLVNCDLFGEGFDLPAIEVVSLVRKTESMALYRQQVGRVFRVMVAPAIFDHWGDYTDAQRLEYIAASIKPKAIIIDHVGNVARHGLPDVARGWTLDARDRRSRAANSDAIPLRTCANPECLNVYERFLPKCPYCGLVPAVVGRGTPEQVDGDLMELDPSVLAMMRSEIDRIMAPVLVPRGLMGLAEGGLRKAHGARMTAQGALRASIALWAGYQRHLGRTDSEAYRRFFYMFGTDVGTAQTLGAREAGELQVRICGYLDTLGVTHA